MTVTVVQCPPQNPCDWKAMVKDTAITICRGTSTVLSAYTMPTVSGATYNWTSSPASTIVNGNTANPTVTPSNTPTVYTVTISVVNSDGTVCTKTAKTTVYWKDCPQIPCDSVKVSYNPNVITICKGDSVQLNPIVTPPSGLTYLWMPSTGLSNATIKNPWAKPTVTTSYNLIVSVPGTNCRKDGSITVIVKDCGTPIPDPKNPTGRVAAEENSSEDIMIAPNPTQFVISVQIPDSMNWEKAALINAQGIILNEQERVDEAKSVKFDVQSHPSGMYIVRVKTDKGFVNKKVIKE
jgi:Secretion system C-terminal sorting domain